MQIDQETNIQGDVSKVIIICLSMIFIAHATITESNK